MTIKRRINRVIFYLAVILVCIVVATPFVIMISYSLRSTQEIFSLSQSIIPANVTLEAYRNALYDYSYSGVGFGTWSINSIWVCGIATFLAIFFSAMLGYAISRFKFTGRKSLLFMIALTQTIPWIIILIPYYMTISKFGMTNNLWVLMITYMAVFIPTSAWLFVGFFNKIGIEVEEAAPQFPPSPL